MVLLASDFAQRYVVGSSRWQRLLFRGMPLNLIFVRHGQSEGNLFNDAAKAGRDIDVRAEFLLRPGSDWRLTSRGREQAAAAGVWLREHYPLIHRAYTSPYIRARETSAVMDLRNVRWFINPLQRERNWGIFDKADADRAAEYRAFREEMRADPLRVAPPGGESIYDLIVRACLPLYGTVHRECSYQNVVVVCHGEIMWAHLMYLLRMTPEQYRELDNSRNPADRINNCQIITFSRQNPETGRVSRYLEHYRSVCPWDTARSYDWKRIVRPVFSREELLAQVEAVPQLLDDIAA